MFALFQVYWGQRQSYILWACLESEPSVAVGTIIFFFLGEWRAARVCAS